jgi:hypothetical protein
MATSQQIVFLLSERIVVHVLEGSRLCGPPFLYRETDSVSSNDSILIWLDRIRQITQGVAKSGICANNASGLGIGRPVAGILVIVLQKVERHEANE